MHKPQIIVNFSAKFGRMPTDIDFEMMTMPLDDLSLVMSVDSGGAEYLVRVKHKGLGYQVTKSTYDNLMSMFRSVGSQRYSYREA